MNFILPNHRIHLSRTAAETSRLSAGLGIAAVRAGDAKAVRLQSMMTFYKRLNYRTENAMFPEYQAGLTVAMPVKILRRNRIHLNL